MPRGSAQLEGVPANAASTPSFTESLTPRLGENAVAGTSSSRIEARLRDPATDSCCGRQRDPERPRVASTDRQEADDGR